MINTLKYNDINELYICGDKNYIERIIELPLFKSIKVTIIGFKENIIFKEFDTINITKLPEKKIKILIAARFIKQYELKLKDINYDLIDASFFGIKSKKFKNFEESKNIKESKLINVNLGVNSDFEIDNTSFYFDNKPSEINIGFNSRLIIKNSVIEDNVNIFLGNNSELIIEEGTYLCSDIDINLGSNLKVYIGKNIFISSNTIISCVDYCDLTIKDNSTFGPYLGIYAYAPILIEEDVMISSYCYIGSGEAHDLFIENEKNYPKEIRIGSHSWIGYGCKILKGTKLFSNSVVGANTLLKNKITNESLIIYGNPNKTITKSFKWNRDYTAYREIRESFKDNK